MPYLKVEGRGRIRVRGYNYIFLSVSFFQAPILQCQLTKTGQQVVRNYTSEQCRLARRR